MLTANRDYFCTHNCYIIVLQQSCQIILPRTYITAVNDGVLRALIDKSSRVCRENTDKSIRDNTLVTATVKDFDSYDTIFVGYPIWWDTYAWPVDGFLGVNNLQGKTIYPFCTSGGSSVDGSVASLRANYKDAKIVDGMRIYRNTSASEIQNWIDSQK
ncbi:MAG: flavodoxin, partial [Succinatimonas sp.]|nr:flavodoxin [Succinatimonas sp.]